jgi:hypothetical protein
MGVNPIFYFTFFTSLCFSLFSGAAREEDEQLMSKPQATCSIAIFNRVHAFIFLSCAHIDAYQQLGLFAGARICLKAFSRGNA